MAWIEAVGLLLLGFYWTAAAALAAFGTYYLVVVVLRALLPSHLVLLKRAEPLFVTIQIPLRNERYVVERVLGAVAALEWPRDRLEVQVLDDSDDDTTVIAKAAVARIQREGVDAQLLRRPEPVGYKAGALNAGLRQARGDAVAIFDADFVPPPEFLAATVPFLAPTNVACVQTRWGYLNESYSWLTRSLAVALDAHFAIEQEVRRHHRLLMSFNATACVWKRSALDALGGWPTGTLTEDLDLTLRALARGLRFEYLETPRVPCEIPVEVLGFARQQGRWARGGAQNLRLHGDSILRSPQLRYHQRADSFFHLAHYAFQPLLFLLFLSSLGILFAGRDPHTPATAAFATLAAAGPLLLLIDGQRRTHPRTWPFRLWRLLPLTLFGLGTCFRTTITFLGGLVGRPAEFVRTPKYSITGQRGRWRGSAYVPRPDLITWAEGLLGMGGGASAFWAYSSGRIPLAVSLALFALSFAWVFAHSMAEHRPALPRRTIAEQNSVK